MTQINFETSTAADREDIARAGTSPDVSYKQDRQLISKPVWIGALIAAGLPRIVCALLLPNPDGDAYSYLESILRIRGHILSGSLPASDLAGFWLPLYQFVCGVVAVPFGHPILVAKVLSAFAGTGECLLVLLICRRLTNRAALALAGFAVLALNPFHILSSSCSMTESTFGLFVLASLHFVLEAQWTASALMVTLAALTRVEAWPLALLLPALQIAAHRKLPIKTLVISMAGPLLCLCIYYLGSGDPLGYFHERARYIAWVLNGEPALAPFTVSRLLRDVWWIIYSANPLILVCAGAGAVYFVTQAIRLTGRPWACGRPDIYKEAASLYFLFLLGFVLTAYVSNNQLVILPRYGLIFFAAGIPLTALVVNSVRRLESRWRTAGYIVLALSILLQWSLQFHQFVKYSRSVPGQLTVADYLHSVSANQPHLCIFADDSAIRVLSGLPSQDFVQSDELPTSRSGFLAELRNRNVEYLVFERDSASTPARILPELAHSPEAGEFIEILHSGPGVDHAEVWLYRLCFTK